MAWTGDGLLVITAGVLLPLLWLSPGRFMTIQALDGGVKIVAAEEPWLLNIKMKIKKKMGSAGRYAHR